MSKWVDKAGGKQRVMELRSRLPYINGPGETEKNSAVDPVYLDLAATIHYVLGPTIILMTLRSRPYHVESAKLLDFSSNNAQISF